MKANIYKILLYISISAMIAVIVGQVVWTTHSHKVIRQAGYTLIQLSLAKSSYDFNRKVDRIVDVSGQKPEFSQMQMMIDSSLKSEFSGLVLVGDLEYSIYQSNKVLYKSNESITDAEVFDSKLSRAFYYEKDSPAIMVSVVAPKNIGYYMRMIYMDVWWIISMLGFATIAIIAILLLRSMKKSKLEANTRVKVINNIAHEFKTPLASIKLAGEMLGHAQVVNSPEKVQRYSDLILYEVKRLQSQTEQFQNVVLLEEGQISLYFDNFSINEVLNKLISHYVLVRGEYHDRLKTDLQAEIDLIYSDKNHFESVIINLLDNAFRHGGADVKVVVSTYSDNDYIFISISDNGVGIAKEYHKLIFERFFRVSPINNHDVKGHGIGLYYVKSILKQLGGEITLNSVPGKGTTFEISFPFDNKYLEK